MSDQAQFKRELAALVKKHDNALCADCRMQAPTWASFNLGIFICMNCAGCHRSLGTHISRVRSITLDNWDRASVDLMHALGNAKANAYWEANVPPHMRINAGTNDNTRMEWIRSKYVMRSFYGEPSRTKQHQQHQQSDVAATQAELSRAEKRALRQQARAQAQAQTQVQGGANTAVNTTTSAQSNILSLDTPSSSTALASATSSYSAMVASAPPPSSSSSSSSAAVAANSAASLFAGMSIGSTSSPAASSVSVSGSVSSSSTPSSSSAAETTSNSSSAPAPAAAANVKRAPRLHASSPWVQKQELPSQTNGNTIIAMQQTPVPVPVAAINAPQPAAAVTSTPPTTTNTLDLFNINDASSFSPPSTNDITSSSSASSALSSSDMFAGLNVSPVDAVSSAPIASSSPPLSSSSTSSILALYGTSASNPMANPMANSIASASPNAPSFSFMQSADVAPQAFFAAPPNQNQNSFVQNDLFANMTSHSPPPPSATTTATQLQASSSFDFLHASDASVTNNSYQSYQPVQNNNAAFGFMEQQTYQAPPAAYNNNNYNNYNNNYNNTSFPTSLSSTPPLTNPSQAFFPSSITRSASQPQSIHASASAAAAPFSNSLASSLSSSPPQQQQPQHNDDPFAHIQIVDVGTSSPPSSSIVAAASQSFAPKAPNACDVDGCNNNKVSRGLCSKHIREGAVVAPSNNVGNSNAANNYNNTAIKSPAPLNGANNAFDFIQQPSSSSNSASDTSHLTLEQLQQQLHSFPTFATQPSYPPAPAAAPSVYGFTDANMYVGAPSSQYSSYPPPSSSAPYFHNASTSPPPPQSYAPYPAPASNDLFGADMTIHSHASDSQLQSASGSSFSFM